MTPIEILTTVAIYCGIFFMIMGCLTVVYVLFNIFFTISYGDDYDD